MAANLVDLSKHNYIAQESTIENIQVSALVRIANATEIIAQNNLDLLNQIEKYKKDAEQYYGWYKDEKLEKEALVRSVNSYKGTVTRLKNKIERLKKEIFDCQ